MTKAALVIAAVLAFTAVVGLGLAALRRMRLSSSPRRLHVKDEKLRRSSLTSYKGLQYWTQVQIGSQPFSLIFDTGSSNVWVPSEQCNNCAKSDRRYAPTSLSVQLFNESAQNAPVKIKYGSGNVQGIVLQDEISFGGLSVISPFVDASYVASKISEAPFDGICGFGMPALSKPGLKPIWLSMIEQNVISEPVFSVYLDPRFELHKTNPDGGEIIIGGIDDSKIEGGNRSSIVWSPLVPFAGTDVLLYWEFDVSVKVNGKTLRSQSGLPFPFTAMSDTGTSVISVPRVLWDAIGLGRDATDRIVSCSSIPSLTFVIEGVEFEISAEELGVRSGWFSLGCESLIQPLPRGLEESSGDNHYFPIILGDVFLRRFFSVYDWGNKRVGFAKGAQSL